MSSLPRKGAEHVSVQACAQRAAPACSRCSFGRVYGGRWSRKIRREGKSFNHARRERLRAKQPKRCDECGVPHCSPARCDYAALRFLEKCDGLIETIKNNDLAYMDMLDDMYDDMPLFANERLEKFDFTDDGLDDYGDYSEFDMM